MLVLLLFAAGMAAVGAFMVLSPMGFARGIDRFSNHPRFHWFEISSRLIFGLAFFVSAQFTDRVFWLYFFAILCVFTSVLLLFVGAEKHIAFAKQTVKIGEFYRWIGLGILSFSYYLLTLALPIN